jgi:hypothetical protein
MTPSFAYRKDQLIHQGVHTAHNRWHELPENDRKHSNITCRAELNVGPGARERTVECNSMLDPKGLKNSDDGCSSQRKVIEVEMFAFLDLTLQMGCTVQGRLED